MPKLLIIDGSSMLSTSYYGNLPKSILFAKTEEEKEKHYGQILHTSDGKYTNAMFTMLRTWGSETACGRRKAKRRTGTIWDVQLDQRSRKYVIDKDFWIRKKNLLFLRQGICNTLVFSYQNNGHFKSPIIQSWTAKVHNHHSFRFGHLRGSKLTAGVFFCFAVAL